MLTVTVGLALMILFNDLDLCEAEVLEDPGRPECDLAVQELDDLDLGPLRWVPGEHEGLRPEPSKSSSSSSSSIDRFSLDRVGILCRGWNYSGKGGSKV